MKIYRFYIIPEEDNNRRDYELYAVTNHKEYAEEFEATRNMKKFIKRVTSEDKETYIQFANENRGSVLTHHKCTTRDAYDNGLIGIKDVEILCTENEYIQFKDQAEATSYCTTEEYWSIAPPYKIYKSKLKAALRKLEYISNYKFYRLEADIDPSDDDYSAPGISIDELGAFIALFKRTF